MAETAVTQLWMFGVMGVMVAYGVLAAIGAWKSASRRSRSSR